MKHWLWIASGMICLALLAFAPGEAGSGLWWCALILFGAVAACIVVELYGDGIPKDR